MNNADTNINLTIVKALVELYLEQESMMSIVSKVKVLVALGNNQQEIGGLFSGQASLNTITGRIEWSVAEAPEYPVSVGGKR